MENAGADLTGNAAARPSGCAAHPKGIPAIEIEHRIRIDGDLDAVWSILADIPNWPGWTPTVRAASAVPGDGPPRFVLKQPMQRAATWTVTDWRRGRGFAWERAQGRLRYRAEHALLPEVGSIVSIARLRVVGAGAATRFFMTPILEAALAVENRALKRCCETGARRGKGPVAADGHGIRPDRATPPSRTFGGQAPFASPPRQNGWPRARSFPAGDRGRRGP